MKKLISMVALSLGLSCCVVKAQQFTGTNVPNTQPYTANVQSFTTTGANTWTAPAGINWVQVFLCGAGGGGGGGGKQISGTAISGGGGGGGGFCNTWLFKASDVGASQTVTIGTIGTFGVAASTNTTAGGNAGGGGNTTFGSLATAFGGGGGAGGQLNAASGGGGGGIGVAVQRHALVAHRLADEGQGDGAAAKVGLVLHLVVRDHHRDAEFASDVKGLLQ